MDHIDESSDEQRDAASEHPNSIRAFDTLGAFLEEDEWYPTRAEGWHGYWMTYTGTNAEIRCFAQIRVASEILMIYAMSPVRIPEDQRPAIAEFVCRANYGLNIGNFELDFKEGRLRFKVSLDFEGADLSPSLIRNAIYPAVRTLNSYIPGVLKVLYGNMSPADAIAEIEG